MSGIQGLLAATQRGLGSLKVVMATGLYKTAAGVVGAKLLKDNAEGLRTYLAIQLRSSQQARTALASIEDAVEHGDSTELTKGPTKKAGLYLAARNLVGFERLFGAGGPDQPASAVPWEATPPGRPDRWGRALDEMRFGLGRDEGEVLELHHVRGLTIDELAYVLGLGVEDAKRKLDAGAGYAKILLEDVFGPDVPKLEGVLRDAFAVMPPTPEELAAASKPLVVPLPPGTVIGDRYEIETKIGGGEFAYVYRARDVKVPGHIVALKLLHRAAKTPAAREGAMRELSLIASAFHPSLVHFKDHGWFEERLWFVMPFYEGDTLLERLEQGSLSIEEAFEYFERLARALAALHASGIRHQDIKPENIKLVRLQTGGAKDRPELLPILLDLGVAAPNGELALAGTPMYFPPEIAVRIFEHESDLPVTPKADVFALALSLLHSIEEPDVSDLIELDVDAFLQKRAKLVPSGPRSRALAWLEPRFRRWLAYHPNDRPTAGQLADELAELRAHLGGRSVRASSGGTSWAVAGALGVFLSMLFVLAATITDSRLPAPSSSAPVIAPVARDVLPESDRVRLVRARLQTEQERSRALERELQRLRRRELGLDVERASAPAVRPAEPPSTHRNSG